MPLTIVKTGESYVPVFIGNAAPVSTVPSKREALEALAFVQRLTIKHYKSAMVAGDSMSWEQACDSLRRFILTR